MDLLSKRQIKKGGTAEKVCNFRPFTRRRKL